MNKNEPDLAADAGPVVALDWLGLGLNLHELTVCVHICPLSGEVWEGSDIQGHRRLHSKFETSLEEPPVFKNKLKSS